MRKLQVLGSGTPAFRLLNETNGNNGTPTLLIPQKPKQTSILHWQTKVM